MKVMWGANAVFITYHRNPAQKYNKKLEWPHVFPQNQRTAVNLLPKLQSTSLRYDLARAAVGGADNVDTLAHALAATAVEAIDDGAVVIRRHTQL